MRNALPAAVEVSIACSVAFKSAPLRLRVRTMSYRSLIERTRRSIRGDHQHVTGSDEVGDGGLRSDPVVPACSVELPLSPCCTKSTVKCLCRAPQYT
jgi:hypothetical protein